MQYLCPVNVVDSEDPNIVASFLECVLPLQPFPCHNRTLGVSRVVDKLPEPKHFLVGGAVGILLHKQGWKNLVFHEYYSQTDQRAADQITC